MTLNDFVGQVVIIRDATGSSFEGTLSGFEDGMLPEVYVKNCRQVNWQDATSYPLKCEAWEVGDQVFLKHHIVGIHKTNLEPRKK
jgi:hypothetical protein